MPLITSIKRNGELLSVNWSEFHVVAMGIAATLDANRKDKFSKTLREDLTNQGWVYPETLAFSLSSVRKFMILGYMFLAATPLSAGTYTMREAYTFHLSDTGEAFTIEAGDELSAWRQ